MGSASQDQESQVEEEQGGLAARLWCERRCWEQRCDGWSEGYGPAADLPDQADHFPRADNDRIVAQVQNRRLPCRPRRNNVSNPQQRLARLSAVLVGRGARNAVKRCFKVAHETGHSAIALAVIATTVVVIIGHNDKAWLCELPESPPDDGQLA